MEHENDEYYNDYEHQNNYEDNYRKIYNSEKEMYPTLRSGRRYRRDLDNDEMNDMEIKDVPIPNKIKREYDMKMDIDGKRKGGFSTKKDKKKAYQARRRHNQCCGLKGHFMKEYPNPGMKRGNKNIRVRVNVPPEKYVMDMFNEKADSGASVSLISDKLRKELNIPIIEKSDIRFIMANGTRVASKGKKKN
ncbi:hypothetical protein C1646_777360 [Rhizophagus diaphanus]|nr:hypothetical protein C1646_777360 [Rhizophagus diaphanus] [Rhizophagus sp. MUCL 43196]